MSDFIAAHTLCVSGAVSLCVYRCCKGGKSFRRRKGSYTRGLTVRKRVVFYGALL